MLRLFPLITQAYRKEERLAATILRQKESRQQNFMKSREEFIASSITSAFVGGGGGGGVAPIEPMRVGPVYGKVNLSLVLIGTKHYFLV